MALALLFILALISAFFCPLFLPWRKSALYVWLAIWFGSWLVFFGLSQHEHIHYSGASNSNLFALFIALFTIGSVIRVTSRSIATGFRRRKDRPLRSPASGA